jgi:cytochrome c
MSHARGFVVSLLAILAIASTSSAGDTSVATADGVFTRAQAERGRIRYVEHCASCHGEGLNGVDMAPPLAGAAFLANWSGLPVDDLVVRIKTTMPVEEPETLGQQTVVDITAYLLMMNDMPGGDAELPTSRNPLRQTIIGF